MAQRLREIDATYRIGYRHSQIYEATLTGFKAYSLGFEWGWRSGDETPDEPEPSTFATGAVWVGSKWHWRLK